MTRLVSEYRLSRTGSHSLKESPIDSTMVAQIKPSGNGVVKEDENAWIIGKNAFNAMAIHHQGVKELWEKKWKFPVCICLRFLSA